jgi:hypothetical protein
MSLQVLHLLLLLVLLLFQGFGQLYVELLAQ